MSADIFQAIADPTRREIIGLLAEQDMTVSEITTHFDMTRPGVSKHLKVLKDSQLVSVDVQGRERIHRLNPHSLKGAAEWINYFSQFWDNKLLALKTAVEEKE